MADMSSRGASAVADADVIRIADPFAGGPKIIASLFALGLTLVLMQAAFPIG
jgi:hypothetical protein